MPKMIELIRQSAVPANVVRSAARGALTLPPGEMLEILVYLAGTPIFGEQARMTLAGWDEAASSAVAADPLTSWEVLSYLVTPANLRPPLLPALLENPSVREAALLELAQKNSREIIECMLASKRVRKSDHLLHALLANPALTEAEIQKVNSNLHTMGLETAQIEAYHEVQEQEKTQYEIEHAEEIAAEEAQGKPFSYFGVDEDEDLDQLEALAPVEETAGVEPGTEPSPEQPAQAVAAAGAAGAAATPAKADDGVKAKERTSTLQKIARLSVGQRIQLAMKGNKEERFVLVRDGSKLVSQAVLQSPKVTDGEIEMFAGMKNVQEGVLRDIGRSHKFMKNYNVVRSLTNNPRCPLDLSLTLMGHMMVGDLKALSSNKNIPDTLRKLALKRFKDKTEKK